MAYILYEGARKEEYMKKFCLVILSVCLFIFSLNCVKADDISYKRLNNIYFNLTVDGKFESNHVTMFILDGRLAYCIEPGKDINTKYYEADKIILSTGGLSYPTTGSTRRWI